MKILEVYFGLIDKKAEIIENKNNYKERHQDLLNGTESFNAFIVFFFLSVLIVTSHFLFNSFFQDLYDIEKAIPDLLSFLPEYNKEIINRGWGDIFLNQRDITIHKLDDSLRESYYLLVYLKIIFLSIGSHLIALKHISKKYLLALLISITFLISSTSLVYFWNNYNIDDLFQAFIFIFLIIYSMIGVSGFICVNKFFIPKYRNKESKKLLKEERQNNNDLIEVEKNLSTLSNKIVNDESAMNEIININYNPELQKLYIKKYKTFNNLFVKNIIHKFENEEISEENRIQDLVNERFQREKIIND